MTTRILAVLGATLIWMSAAVADPIAVRSGEHDDFTRLVMQLPSRLDWRLRTETGTANIYIDGLDDGFDLSRAFSIIPRTRLTAILGTAGGLELKLACDCPVKAFMEQENYLVIDISDGPPLPAAQPAAAETSRSRIPESDFAFGDLLWSELTERFPTASSESPPGQTDVPSPDLGVLVSPTDRELVLATRKRLLRAFADAATSGIVSVDEQNLGLETAKQQPELPLPAEIFDSSEQPAEPASDPEGNIRITTSHDFPLAETHIPQDVATHCPDPSFLDFSEWGSDGSFGSQISHPDVQVYNELGKLMDSRVLALAKLYLYFGFGAEAKQIARLSPDLERSHPYIFDLGDIFDYGHANASRMLYQFGNCESDLALWGILAVKDASSNTPVNTSAALRGLENLPVHLRSFVGQELSKRFVRRGDPESAGIALRSSERMADESAENASLAQALISESYGKIADAEDVLEDVISQNSEESPEALITLVEQHLDDGKTIPSDLALAIEAFLFEFRNTPVGNDLTRVHILASANSGQFSKAFRAFETAENDNILADPRDTESRLLAMLASRAEDVVFLEHAFELSLSPGHELDQDALLSVAERLVGLGFIDLAETVLLSAESDKNARKQRVLEAQIFLAKGNARSALSRLSDLAGPDVELIRAEALRRQGENSASQDAFLSANDPLGAAITGWTADNWTSLVNPDDPIFGPAKTLAEEQISPVTVSETLLSDTERALQSAAGARRALADLLNAVGSM